MQFIILVALWLCKKLELTFIFINCLVIFASMDDDDDEFLHNCQVDCHEIWPDVYVPQKMTNESYQQQRFR